MSAVDLYGPVHKGLRFAFAETLVRLGTCDGDDAADRAGAMAALGALLDLCESHRVHENRVFHAAIEARRPGASARLGADHEAQARAIAELRAAAAACGDARAVHALYLSVALFVADNLVHMHEEETLAQPLLDEIYAPAELMEIHARLLAGIPAHEMAAFGQVMLPALSPRERAVLIEKMNGSKKES